MRWHLCAQSAFNILFHEKELTRIPYRSLSLTRFHHHFAIIFHPSLRLFDFSFVQFCPLNYYCQKKPRITFLDWKLQTKSLHWDLIISDHWFLLVICIIFLSNSFSFISLYLIISSFSFFVIRNLNSLWVDSGLETVFFWKLLTSLEALNNFYENIMLCKIILLPAKFSLNYHFQKYPW